MSKFQLSLVPATGRGRGGVYDVFGFKVALRRTNRIKRPDRGFPLGDDSVFIMIGCGQFSNTLFYGHQLLVVDEMSWAFQTSAPDWRFGVRIAR
jgi:hypothetical protein